MHNPPLQPPAAQTPAASLSGGAASEAARALLAAAAVLLLYAVAQHPGLAAPLQWALREGLGFAMVALPVWRSASMFPRPQSQRSLVAAAWLAAALLPGWLVGRSLLLHAWTPVWPPVDVHTATATAAAVWTHVLAVALPEELFWRGWVQPALAARWPARRRLAGAPVGVAVLASCALFALSHVVGGGPWLRLATFFPGLVFAWLMARHGAVSGPWALHAACNLTALAAHWALPIFPPRP